MSDTTVTNEIDWNEICCHDGRLINFEKTHAIVFDKPFDQKLGIFAFGGAAIVKNEDGSFDSDPAKRCPSLSLNTVSLVIESLLRDNSSEIIFIDSLDELPFDAKLFYDTNEIYERMVKCSKIIVTFENDEIGKIYAYKLKSMFKYRVTLITFSNLMKQKESEIDRNITLQNLFITMNALGNKQFGNKTPSGLVVP